MRSPLPVLFVPILLVVSCDKQVNEAGRKVGNASTQFTEGLLEKPMDKLKQQQAENQRQLERDRADRELERIDRERRASYDQQKRKAEAEQRVNQQRLRRN